MFSIQHMADTESRWRRLVGPVESIACVCASVRVCVRAWVSGGIGQGGITLAIDRPSTSLFPTGQLSGTQLKLR